LAIAAARGHPLAPFVIGENGGSYKNNHDNDHSNLYVDFKDRTSGLR
jgi:hypothetical protein